MSARPATSSGPDVSTPGQSRSPRTRRSTCAVTLPFMESVRTSLVEQDVPEADIHYEVFGPDKWLASA